MADEARLNELLDLVEQARAEGDSATEQKAIAAYKRESAPAAPEAPRPVGTYPIGLDPMSAYAANYAQRANDTFKAIENRLGVTAEPGGASNLAGPLETIATGASSLAGQVTGGIAGIGQGLWNSVVPESMEGPQAADRVRQVSDAMTYQPRTHSGQVLTGLASLPGEALSRGTTYLGEKVADKTGSPLLGTIIKTAGEALPAAIPLARGTKRAPADRPNESFERPQLNAPTVEQLKSRASEAYKRSENIGAVVNQDRFATFQRELSEAMQKQGIDKDLHPDASAAMKRVMAESGPMTLEKMETMRRIAMDAEGSLKPADARKAGEIVDAIDNMVEGLKPSDLSAGTPEAAAALKQARGLWSRARKAEVLDELQRRAELSAPNFSGSGIENALRTEFRALAKNQRRMRQFSREERAAIERVAKGGPVENTLRFLGKAAPTGVVSAGLGSGLGLAIGGPAGAIGVPALGAISRLGARGLTNRNVRLANELVRAGRSVDDFLGYAGSLGRQNVARGGSTPSAAGAGIGAGAGLDPASAQQIRAGAPASGPTRASAAATRGGAVPQVPGPTSGKTLEQLYLEALVEELRMGR